MPGLKRLVANALGKVLDVSIVPHASIGLLFEREHLRRFLSEFHIDCVFDVGANAGQYGQMIRELGFRGAIISFEPIPSMANTLKKKVKHDTLWFVEEVALDSEMRDTTFNVMRSSQFSSLNMPSHADTDLFREENAVAYTVELRTKLLSTFISKYESQLGFKRPFLKMDTQGNDLAVAQGAGDFLSRFIGLQSELAIKKIYDSAGDYRSLIDYYTDRGFELSALVPNNRGHFPTLIEIDCIMLNTRHRRDNCA